VNVPEDDWSTQLKKIEREFEGLPPEPSVAYTKMQSEEQRRAQEKAMQRRALIGSMARLLLVLALGVALFMWPYENGCGSGLFGYLGVEAMMFVGGFWVAVTTWRARLAKTHTVSLLVMLASLMLMAGEVLPRVGYAKVDLKAAPTWFCADPA
jgi:cation transport ATPase